MRRIAWTFFISSGVALAIACSVSDLDYSGKTCTDFCPTPLNCVNNVCTAPSDAQADVTTDGGTDAIVPSFCEAGRFCDDFERTTLQGAWDSVDVSDDGVLEIVAEGDAGNHVLQASIVDGSATMMPRASMTKQLGTVDTITYTFRLFVQGTVWESASLARSAVAEQDTTYGSIDIELLYSNDVGAAVYHSQTTDSGPAGGTAHLAAIPLGKWCAIKIASDYVALTLKITVDGTIAYDNALYAPSPNWSAGAGSVVAGLIYTSNGLKDNSTFVLRIDDVVVDYTP